MDPRKTNARRGYSDRQKKKREKSRAEAAAGWQLNIDNTKKTLKERVDMNRTLQIVLRVFCGLLTLAAILFPIFGIFRLSGWIIIPYIIGTVLLVGGILGVTFTWPPQWYTWVLLVIGIILIILSIVSSNIWGWGMSKTVNSDNTVDLNIAAPTPTLVVDQTENITPEPPQTHGNGNPQSYVPHPNFYVETTVSSKEYTWTIIVNEGEIGIAGGWSVNGQDRGTYKAFGPGTYTMSIIDGFALTVEKQWALDEWNFRIGQAIQYGWSHKNLDPGPITTP